MQRDILVVTAKSFQPELDAGTYAAEVKIEKLTIDQTTVLYGINPNFAPGAQFITFKFLATADKAIAANVGLPQSADGVAAVKNLVQLYLANNSKLP